MNNIYDNEMKIEFLSKSNNEAFARISVAAFVAQLDPTLEEIAKEVGVDKEEIVMSLDAIQDPVSLQEPIYNEGSESIYIMDQIKDIKNTDEAWADNITITEAMKKLNGREKSIISKRFFDGRTQMEVAEEIGISQAQVSRLEKSAIDRIKKLYLY